MTDTRFLEESAPAVIDAVLATLRADPNVQAVLGNPARVFDGDAPIPAYPHAILERHECVAADHVCKRGLEHTLHFATYTRHDGVEVAKRLLSALRRAVAAMALDLTGQKVSLILPTYSDVLRTKSPHILRGVLRLRIVTEEV